MFGLDIKCIIFTIVTLNLTLTVCQGLGFANSDVNGVSEYSNVCPFNTCPSGSTQLYSTRQCCQPCWCEGSCVADNCCPGVQRHPTVKANCRSQHEMYNLGRVQTDSIIENDYEWLYVVDNCRNDIPQLGQHQARCAKPSELEDYVIVMNLNGSALFKNDQCAKCNGVFQTVKWSLAYYDTVNVSHGSISVLKDSFQYTAFSSFPPPNKSILLLKEYLCSSNDIIDTCILEPSLNNTQEGQHAKYMCEMTNRSEFGLYFSKGMIFKNIFCAYCFFGEYHCPLIDKINNKDGLVSVSFHVILDVNRFINVWANNEDIPARDYRCQDSKYFDPMSVR